MSTDAFATLEPATGAPGHAAPPLAKILLRRDYVLFDLIAGGRSGDPGDAVVAIRPVRWPGCTEDDPASTWLLASELELVAARYREATGHVSEDLVALIATMREHDAGREGATRCVVHFF